jgi:AcrR family transcriptional regulator
MDELASTRPYHHGDLRKALLEEAERVLEEKGVQGLSLRSMARAVGVTHAAPARHFGDLTGLLSELAAVGFHRFAGDLARALRQAGTDPSVRGRAMAHAYLGFAKAHPGLFALMFRSERLDPQRPALKEAIAAARDSLRQLAAERPTPSEMTPLALAARAVALWSLVHGFAALMLEGRLVGTLAALPGNPSAEDLFDAMLNAVTLK